MTNPSYPRDLVGQLALQHYSPHIRRSMLDDSEFVQSYGIQVATQISFGSEETTFDRGEFNDAIRSVYRGDVGQSIKSASGREWQLKLDSKSGIFLESDAEKVEAPKSTRTLSQDLETRVGFLDDSFRLGILSERERLDWHSKLSHQPLSNDELGQLDETVFHTPEFFAARLQAEFKNGSSSYDSLVPRTTRYYEKLVGGVSQDVSFSEFVASDFANHIDSLLSSNQPHALLACLLCSSHLSLVECIDIEDVCFDDLEKAFLFLRISGDLWSQLGAIELGFRCLKRFPKLEEHLIELVEKVRDDDPSDASSRFALLNSLFVLVDGELANARVFSSKPPFYRRLSSCAHAAVIERQLIRSNVATDQFSEIALRNRFWPFRIQSSVDLRLEPRWFAVMSSGDQFKQEFICRLFIAFEKYGISALSSDLKELFLGEASELSLWDKADPHLAVLPGPLEGWEREDNPVPVELSQKLELTLEEGLANPSSLNPIINTALAYNLEPKYADKIVESLEQNGNRLGGVTSQEEFQATLIGLACIAATGRNRNLAEKIRVVCRVHRFSSNFKLSMRDSFYTALVAVAAEQNEDKWMELLGQWITEIAFDAEDKGDAEVVKDSLDWLLHFFPSLWKVCGRAHAALAAFVRSEAVNNQSN